MKKVLYQSLYRVLLFLSNHLNSKLIVKHKVLLGTSLIVLMSSAYQAPKKSNAVVHDKPMVIDDTVKVQNEPDDNIILCYMPARDFLADPEFPGGQQALLKYINDSIRYPEKAKENGIQGRVNVIFFVNEDGTVSDAEILYSPDSLLNKEALRVVSSMPQWTPGKARGKATRVKYSVPVRFRLDK